MVQIGFDIGGTNIKAGAVKDNMEIVARRNVPFPVGASYEDVLEIMAALISDISHELKIGIEAFKSIGIGIPGSIDKHGTTVINAHNLGFHNVPIKAAIGNRFPDLPVFLANDADVAALAELHAGVFRGYKTAVLITLGTGVGGGVILDGRMFNGGQGNGIELGHMILQHGGPMCTCGNRGCVEALCSASRIISEGKNALSEHPNSLICDKTAGKAENVTAKIVIDCAKEGDPIAKAIFGQYLDHLSSAIISITSLLDPEVIALGGGISLAGDFLFKPLNEIVRERSFFKTPYPVVPAQLGNNAGIIGASMLARNQK